MRSLPSTSVEFPSFWQTTRRGLWLAGLILGLTLGQAVQAQAQKKTPAPLKILFLGDNGHHQPLRRFEQIQPVLADRGIELQYADGPAVLTPEKLKPFDGILLYANIDEISAPQAQALLDYVASGKGFIPLHCASFCFRNNDDVVALIGAQFQRHGTGVFRVQPSETGARHPLMKGYRGFESWDETYVHTKHNEKDRTVLEYRVEGDTNEPWTWVRTQGKGRVFYTAWGHDERTWSNAGFQNLLERGIRWACGQDVNVVAPYVDRPEMTPLRKDVQPFEFVDAELPFYPPGKAWGTTDGPLRKLQKPLPAEESLKHYVTPVGFHVELFAAEPQIGKPLSMNWDERGRLWICESVDYPNDLQPEGQGHDRIRICEDTDGDGKADKFTVFAENLSIPAAICFHRGGAIVQDGPRTIYLKDTNGDDQADVRKVLITGWAMNDTHGGVSNFQFGPDNWFYGMQGYNQSRPAYNGKETESFRMGFFRFRLNQSDDPEVEEVEFLRSTNNNTWGLGFSEEGLIFGSTANGNPSEYLPIPNRYYERVRGWSSSVLGGIAESNKFDPITENVRQVDHHGGFTAAAGHVLYTARAWPEEYWNRTAFVTEATGHLIATFVITPDGAGFHSKNSWNILASDDGWAAPIMAEVGPDGQLWVADWYNPIIQHNPTPAGYKTGKGNAYEINLRDKSHGRIYRVVYGDGQGGQQPAIRSLQGATPEQLAAALQSDNFFWRRQAQRLIMEAPEDFDLDPVLQLLGQPMSENPGVIHALWIMSGRVDFKPPQAGLGAGIVMLSMMNRLTSPSAAVRRNAVAALPAMEPTADKIVETQLVQDKDAQVRLAALLKLSECPPKTEVAAALVPLFQDQKLLADRWLGDGLVAAAAQNAAQVLSGVAQLPQDTALDPKALQLLAIVAEHYSRGGPAREIQTVLGGLAHAAPATAEVILAGLAKGWPKDLPAELNDQAPGELVELLKGLPAGGKAALITLSAQWKVEALQEQIAAIAGEFLTVAENEEADEAQRIAAARQYIELKRQDVDASEQVLELVTARTPPELARGLFDAVARSDAPETGAVLVEKLSSLTPALRSLAMRGLLSRADWTKSLLDAIDAGQVLISDLALDQKQALAAHPNRQLAERAKAILARGGGLPNPDRQKVVEELLPLTEQKGDAVAGKEVFKKQCSKCHTHSGEGGQVGPDLTGMAVHPKHELLIHLIDPSRSVEGNFRVYTVVLNDGRVMSGLLASESKTAIEIIDAEAKKHALQRDDIDELVASTKSLMPEGFEKQVSHADITNLLEFLTQRGKYIPLPLNKVATITTTKGMFFNDDGDLERLIFPDWKPKMFDGVPFVLVDPQGDRVPNAVMLRGPNGVKAPRMPTSVSLPCNAPAKAIHFLSGVGGWSFPAEPRGGVSMIVRLHYHGGDVEEHRLINGEHFADYIRRVDVPGSKFAFALRGQQIRYLAIQPERDEVIDSIDLVKGNDRTAPVVMAVTVEQP